MYLFLLLVNVSQILYDKFPLFFEIDRPSVGELLAIVLPSVCLRKVSRDVKQRGDASNAAALNKGTNTRWAAGAN